MGTKGYQRLQRFEISEVLPHIGKAQEEFFVESENRNFLVKRLTKQRLKLFTRVQHCEVCLIHGSHFWLERAGCWSPHFNLYAVDYFGEETLMTMDHILPRSHGGLTVPENVQLLCSQCNHVKQNFIISNDDVLRLRLRKEPRLFPHVLEAYRIRRPEYVRTVGRLFAQRKNRIDRKEQHATTPTDQS